LTVDLASYSEPGKNVKRGQSQTIGNSADLYVRSMHACTIEEHYRKRPDGVRVRNLPEIFSYMSFSSSSITVHSQKKRKGKGKERKEKKRKRSEKMSEPPTPTLRTS
jgi:hypothetical protein